MVSSNSVEKCEDFDLENFDCLHCEQLHSHEEVHMNNIWEGETAHAKVGTIAGVVLPGDHDVPRAKRECECWMTANNSLRGSILGPPDQPS
jgi:hypothetical protein